MPATTVILRGLPRISLHLSDMVEDVQNSGIMVARRRKPEVVLTEGKNVIDADFWREWKEQNEKSDLLLRSYLVDDAE